MFLRFRPVARISYLAVGVASLIGCGASGEPEVPEALEVWSRCDASAVIDICQAAADYLESAVDIAEMDPPLINDSTTFGYRLHVMPATASLDPFRLAERSDLCTSPCAGLLWIAESGRWEESSEEGVLVWSRTSLILARVDGDRSVTEAVRVGIDLGFAATAELLREASFYDGPPNPHPAIVLFIAS